MVKKFIVFATLVCCVSQASNIFWSEANRATQDTWNGIFRCGLSRMSPYDPRLPRPMVPAKDAIVNSRWQLLAYYNEWVGVYNTLEFKNPNGSLPHAVTFDNRQIQFQSPYSGVVASANEVNTATGPYVFYYCRGYQVSEFQWRECVYRDWVRLITDQLCRYPLQ